MGFDITPPKKRPPVKKPQPPRPAVLQPTPKAAPVSAAKVSKSKPARSKPKKRVASKIFFVLFIFIVVTGVVYAFREGYISLPERTVEISTPDDRTIVTTFRDNTPEASPDDEVETDEGVDVVNDPLMSAHLNFVQMVEVLPETPAPAGYDIREVQLLNSYLNDF